MNLEQKEAIQFIKKHPIKAAYIGDNWRLTPPFGFGDNSCDLADEWEEMLEKSKLTHVIYTVKGEAKTAYTLKSFNLIESILNRMGAEYWEIAVQ